MRGDPEKSGVSVWYLLARRRGSALCLPEGSKSGRSNQRKVEGFSPSSRVQGKGGAGIPDV